MLTDKCETPVGLLLRPNWRTGSPTDADLFFCGDRVVGVVKWATRQEPEINPHMIVLVADEDGWTDSEGNAFSLEDCEWWIPEIELLQAHFDIEADL